MLCACTSSDEKVIAKQTEKNKKPFFCPECLLEVILKKGNINIHHFSHKPGSECSYGEGESEEHMRIKMELYELLSKADIQCDLEKRLVDNDGSVNIADVWAIIDGQEVAIEVQKSSISDEELEERTKKYHKKNIAALWLVVKNNEVKTLNSIENWLKINTGRVYYYYQNNIRCKTLVPISSKHSLVFTSKKYNLITDFISYIIKDKTFYIDKESFEEIKARKEREIIERQENKERQQEMYRKFKEEREENEKEKEKKKETKKIENRIFNSFARGANEALRKLKEKKGIKIHNEHGRSAAAESRPDTTPGGRCPRNRAARPA